MNEDLFITTAARFHHTEDDIILLKKLAKDITDWDALYKMAAMHGVSPMLYHTLTKNSLTRILPQEIFARLKNDFYQTAIRNTNLLQIADQAAKKVQQKIVLLKGADLAQFLYPNIGIRSMCDVDVLVEREQADTIRCVLDREDNVLHQATVYKSKAHEKLAIIAEREAKHLTPVYYPTGRIEIHWNLFGGSQHYDLTQQAWKSIIPVDNNPFLHRLSPDFMLLHLCMHVYSHATQFSYLRMFCDINEFIRKNGSIINWDIIKNIIEGTNLKEKIVTVLSYAHAFFDTPLSEYFVDNFVLCNTKITLTNLSAGLPDVRESPVTQKRKAWKLFRNNINNLSYPSDKLEYIYSTIFPGNDWMNLRYAFSGRINIYCKYIHYCKDVLSLLK